jgi:hypothetical protein
VPKRRPTKPKYPFKRVGNAADMTMDTAEAIAHEDSSAGAGKIPRIPASFQEHANASARGIRLVDDRLTTKLVYAHIERGSSTQKVLDDGVIRAKRAPSRRNLERMGAVANEVGRRRGGGRLLRQTVTQAVVDELIEGSQ